MKHRLRLGVEGGSLPPGLDVICYADDTLVTARGGTLEETESLATFGTEEIVRRIEALRLRMDNTEGLLFHGPCVSPPIDASIWLIEIIHPTSNLI